MSIHVQTFRPVMAFIDGIGGPEVLMVMFIALILFGGKSLPSFARTVGKSLREFKKATSEVEREIKRAIDEAPEEPAPSAPPSMPAAPLVDSKQASQPLPATYAGEVKTEPLPYPELNNPKPGPQPAPAPLTPPSVAVPELKT